MWDIDRANDWAGFRDALKNFVGPPQNMVFADTGGTIGFITAGRIPIRKSGNGWLPVPGWTGDYDWQGFIPFDALPQATNPASGFFISANNKVVPDSYPYFISRDWDLPNRAERITELLTDAPKQSPESQRRDPGRYPVDHGAPAGAADDQVRAVQRHGPRGRQAASAMGFPHGRGQGRAVAVHRLAARFCPSVLFAKLGNAATDYWNLRPRVMEAILTQRPDWCADPQHPERQACDARLSEALDTALDQLRQAYGGEMAQWQWGRAHIAYFPNAVWERVPVLRDWLRVTIPTPGARDTVNVGPSEITDPVHPFEQRFGAGLRIITDMAAPGEARMMITPGQSGNPLSGHYADLLPRWRAFDWLVPGTAPAQSTLTLAPAS